MTEEYDVSTFTEQQKKDWAEYGIIPGPVHNNFDVCDKSCYVTTFEHTQSDVRTGQIMLVDLYVITPKEGNQTILYRTNSEWEGSYGSTPLESFLRSIKCSLLYAQILHILFAKGKFTYASIPSTRIDQ